MFQRVALIALTAASVGCASQMPYQEPVSVAALKPGAGERVAVDHLVVLFDSSGSVEDEFPGAKALLESFVAGAPNGSYTAGGTAFGGFNRQTLSQEKFDRARLANAAKNTRFLNESTPLDRVLGEAGEALPKSGDAAIVLFSDGVPTSYAGTDLDPGVVLDSAKGLAKSRSGKTCLHTVQVGSDPAGASFLRELSSATGCGSFRAADATGDRHAVASLERDVFIGRQMARKAAALPPVSAAPGDRDGDGVIDAKDSCPATPTGAGVDRRGCWTIQGLHFATNSANIESQYEDRLQNVVRVLKQNPSLRIRVDGYTDSRGDAAYNQSLSERRAASVRDYLVAAGIPAGRLVSKGFGEENPAAPNDTAANLRENRRTELTVIR